MLVRVHHALMSQLQMLALCTSLVATTGSAAETLEDGALLRALQRGGYVLLMRHARSPGKPPDPEAAHPDNVKLERELDEIGRETARAMGQAIRRYRIPIGDIESSPTYRALETVKLAGLGMPKSVPELGDVGPGMHGESAEIRSAWLRLHTSEPPRSGTNTLLVTHAPNIIRAFGREAADISEGETLVFHPDGKGSARLVADIKIEDWPRLDKKAP